MLVSLNWIKEFTELPKDESAEKFGLSLTMGTAEVEGVELVNDFWSKLKVVEVTSIEAHPEADKLNLVTFITGKEQSFRVVCGAKNVKLGMKTIFAPIGTTLPIGFTLEPKKIRGILSEGMLCSEEELALADSSEGIVELPEDAPVGTTLDIYYDKKKDVVFDIDNKSLTHRPDLWCHYGMAREFAAIYRKELILCFNEQWRMSVEANFNSELAPVSLELQPDSSCLSYYGISLSNISVGESPDFIKNRLSSVGLRPINNIVDISNYVMLELGIPLHIFDRKKIKGNKISIRAILEPTEFVTLDEVKRDLVDGDTVVCDTEEPLVLAGIMGGLNSGVTETTTDIFIEVANWIPSKVRKTSTRLGLRTDSSMRYEKTLDSQLCYRTLLRTIELVLKTSDQAKVIGSPQYVGNDLKDFKELELKISTEEVCKTLGKEIETSEIVSILESLDFKVKKESEMLSVVVPSYRSTKDVECGADLIEEVGRIIGYDNITPQGPKLDIRPVRLNPLHLLKRKVQDFMSLQAFSFEVNTYPMVGESLLKKAGMDSENCLKLMNSLSTEQDRMRPSIIPSLLEAASLNYKYKENFRFFEIGREYKKDDKSFRVEKDVLAICFYSKQENVFNDLVDSVERLCGFTNIPVNIIGANPKFKNLVVDESWSGIHPFEFMNLRVMGKLSGAVFSVHPTTLKSFKIKGNLALAIIDLSPFNKAAPKEKISYKALPKFPESRFDFTVSLNKFDTVKSIFDVLEKLKLKKCQSHKIISIFSEKAEALKHVTIRSTFLDPEKTLPGEYIKECEEKIISSLEKESLLLKKG